MQTEHQGTTKHRVRTSYGNIAYLERGDRTLPTVLLVHGIPTSSHLWREVMRLLQSDFHCLAPDLMGLGDTDVDPDTTRFDMEAQAEMLLDFMTVLGHETFAVVCHDQGGAAAQLIAARVPDRLTALVLTNCVAYDNWPVPAIARLQRLFQIPLLGDLAARSGLAEWLESSSPFSNFKRGVHDARKLSKEAIAEYLRPLRGSRRQRKLFRKFLLAGDSRYTELAANGLARFKKPTLVVWAADDVYLSPSWGKKLFEEIPGAEAFELIPFCGHFWQEERPSHFVSVIGKFLSKHLAQPELATTGESEDATPDTGPASSKKRRAKARV
jgi:pimeloyl-ACP methyl ester carboxylesterase